MKNRKRSENIAIGCFTNLQKVLYPESCACDACGLFDTDIFIPPKHLLDYGQFYHWECYNDED